MVRRRNIDNSVKVILAFQRLENFATSIYRCGVALPVAFYADDLDPSARPNLLIPLYGIRGPTPPTSH
jgi:hypothetical protein